MAQAKREKLQALKDRVRHLEKTIYRSYLKRNPALKVSKNPRIQPAPRNKLHSRKRSRRHLPGEVKNGIFLLIFRFRCIKDSFCQECVQRGARGAGFSFMKFRHKLHLTSSDRSIKVIRLCCHLVTAKPLLI